MFKFFLDRIEDSSGISGVGRVAEGVIFSNGKCSLCWLTDTSSVAVYESLHDLMQVHGHEGKTHIVVEIPTKPEMPVVIEQQDGGYLATTPWLAGCIAIGDSPMGALGDFFKAFDAIIECYKEENKKVPWKKKRKKRAKKAK